MDELVVDGEKYISSKRAARLSGYAKDYIGQLCRAGKIEAKMVGRSWYVKESAIKDHRKTFQGGPVVDDKLWAEGKNGIEFKGFGAAAPAPRPHLDEDNIKIHYEPDPRPLIPAVGKKESMQENAAEKVITAAPLSSPAVPEVVEITKPEPEVHVAIDDGVPRYQTEEAYDVPIHAVQESETHRVVENKRVVQVDDDEEDPVRIVASPMGRRRISFTLLCLCVGVIIGTGALLSLVETHSVYRAAEAEEFEYVGSHISLWNIVADIKTILRD